MTLVRLTPPPTVPIDLDALLQHLRVGEHEMFAAIGYAQMATAALDGPHGWLGRALTEATYELRLDAFPAAIELPLPPLVAVTSIAYLDPAGVSQTLAPALYQVSGLGGDAPAVIRPSYGNSWPATRCEPESVLILLDAGYTTLPAAIRAGLQLMTGELFEHREISRDDVAVSDAASALLTPYRVW